MNKKPSRIHSILERKGMTQSELAKFANVSKRLVSQLVNGKKENVNVRTANRIAKVLGVTIDYLFGDVV